MHFFDRNIATSSLYVYVNKFMYWYKTGVLCEPYWLYV